MPSIPKIKDGVLSRIWEELKHINYQQLNEKTGRGFTLALAGTKEEIAAMREWLERVDYPLLAKWAADMPVRQDVDAARLSRSPFPAPRAGGPVAPRGGSLYAGAS